MKQKGVLLHISSLPGDFGIGDFGPAALDFAALIKDQGYSIWQILPLNHPGHGNSPYNPISAFALNPLLASPELLYDADLIDLTALEATRIPTSNHIHFDGVNRVKTRLLEQAASAYLKRNDVTPFIQANAFWLKPYITFVILDHLYDSLHWSTWPEQHRSYSEKLWKELQKDFAHQMQAQAAIQAILQEQLSAFSQGLKRLDIQLWGDLPIYLSYHSAELWAHPELFYLDERGLRQRVAGVPPDAFSEDGQLWGNPIYRWDERKEEVFQLFEQRISANLDYVQRLRLDHFIGYVNHWSIDCPIDPATGEPQMPTDAKAGTWLPTPGEQLFERLLQKYPANRFIAEDLGILTPEVCEVRDRLGFEGMIILQFCWQDGHPDVEQFPADRIIYTGTHDNPTTRQWFEELDPESQEYRHFVDYLQHRRADPRFKDVMEDGPSATNAADLMMQVAINSGCETCIFPVQDLLNLGAEARMNIPGTPLGNWEWRIEREL
ncbi:MAG TPA: 4-alpha-glucanotransferase [Candidatus Cloacimonadota bacterium]|nr:4-alpha-glucanotransferase [Candidatus Cloacimonadota bacterium]